jgi:hypothetical protein
MVRSGAKVVSFSCMGRRAEKKWQESIDHFEKRLKVCEELNLRRWWAYDFTYYLVEYARVYLERAHKLLDEALGIYQKIGAKGDMEKVIAKKKLATNSLRFLPSINSLILP